MGSKGANGARSGGITWAGTNKLGNVIGEWEDEEAGQTDSR